MTDKLGIEERLAFQPMSKMPRINRECIVTEKLDGTNGQIIIQPDGTIEVGSKNRQITPENDNYGFARWVSEQDPDDIRKLGVGRHYGEWWGQGIQRKYNMDKKVFSLFYVRNEKPDCMNVVPTLYTGVFDTAKILEVRDKLLETGSIASPGFMNPEGVVVYHVASGYVFKYPFKDAPKGD